MKKNIALLVLEINRLYGELIRAQFGEHTKVGVVVIDVEKIAARVWQIKQLADELEELTKPKK